MKLILTLTFVLNISQCCHAGMKVDDFYDKNGSAIIFWKDMNAEQKAQSLEWEREDAEYRLRNIDKKCSDLKDIPEYTKLYSMHSFAIPPKKFGLTDICFPSTTENLIHDYRTIGDYEKEFAEMRRAHGVADDRLSPEKMAGWLTALISAGRYREAEVFFPEFVNAVYSPLTKEEVVKKIKNREPLPWYLSKGLVAAYWDKILDMKDKSDDLGKFSRRGDGAKDPNIQMHRYFYRQDSAKRAAALEFYREKKIKFMIEKAQKNWKGLLRDKAVKYFEELQKPTTGQ